MRPSAASGGIDKSRALILVRDCGAVPGAVAPPSGRGLPHVVSCGGMIAPEIPFLAHLRTPVPAARLLEVACERVRAGSSWIKLLADTPGADGNMLAATPTYPVELVRALCDAVHQLGGRVAAHSTGQSRRVGRCGSRLDRARRVAGP